MQVWNLLHAARWKYSRQKWRKKSPSAHHHTNLSGCIFAIKACINNRKKVVKQQYLPTCPHNMANFGPLTAEIGSGVWGTPANFNWFRVLAALLQRRHFMSTSCVLLYWQRYRTAVQHQVSAKFCGVVQGMELRNFRRGRHLYSAGRPSRWALAHILVISVLVSQCCVVGATIKCIRHLLWL